MVKFIYRDIPLEDDDQLEVILPLVAYLVVVFGISVMRCVNGAPAPSLMSISSAAVYGRYCAGDDAHRDLYQCQFFIGGPGAAYKYGLGWVLLAIFSFLRSGFRLVFSARSSRFCAPLQCGDTERHAVCPLPESLLVWLASLSLLVAFIGAMTVSLSAARACWKPRRVFLMKPAADFRYQHCVVYRLWWLSRQVLNDTMQGLVMLIGTIVLLMAWYMPQVA